MAGGGGFEDASDAERLATDIKEGLADVYPDDAVGGDVIVVHAEIEVALVAHVDFDMAVGAVGAAGEEVEAGISDFGELNVGPFDDVAEEEFGEDAAGVAEEELEGDVEGLSHVSLCVR